MTLSALEQALLPLVSPLVLSIWQGTLLPAITAELKSGSPEIQILETQLVAMLAAVVPAELAKLATAS